AYNLGVLFAQTGKVEQATTWYQNAWELRDKTPKAAQSAAGAYNLGVLFAQTGNVKQAARWYQNAWELRDRTPEAADIAVIAAERLAHLARRKGLRGLEHAQGWCDDDADLVQTMTKDLGTALELQDWKRALPRTRLLAAAIAVELRDEADAKEYSRRAVSEIGTLIKRAAAIERPGPAAVLGIAQLHRARAWAEIRRAFDLPDFGHDAIAAVEAALRDLDAAEKFEAEARHRDKPGPEAPAETPREPMPDPARDAGTASLLESASELLGFAFELSDRGTAGERLAVEAVGKTRAAHRAAQQATHDPGPVAEAADLALGALTLGLSFPKSSPPFGTAVKLLEAALTLLDVVDFGPEHEQRARAGRLVAVSSGAQLALLCASRFGLVGEVLPEQWQSAEKLLERAEALAAQALELFARSYLVELTGAKGAEVLGDQSRRDAHLTWRRRYAVVVRTWCEAVMRRRLGDGPDSAERTDTSVVAPEAEQLLAASLEASAICESRLLGEMGRAQPAARPTPPRAELLDAVKRLARSRAGWLELAFGFEHLGSFVMNEAGIAEGRIAGSPVDGRGVSADERDLEERYRAFRAVTVQKKVEKAPVGRGDGDTPSRNPEPAELEPALERLWAWIRDVLPKDIEESDRGWIVSPASWLQDLPWVGLGAWAGLDVRAQVLSVPDLVEAGDRPAAGAKPLLLVVSHEDLWAVVRDLRPALREVNAKGWRVLRLEAPAPRSHDESASKEPPGPVKWTELVGHGNKSEKDIDPSGMELSPSVVFWLAHGEYDDASRALRLPVAEEPQVTITAGELARAGLADEAIELPGGVRLRLRHCRAFISGACLSGRIDPRYEREGVGLVRGLFAMGVEEIFAPNFPVLMSPELGIPALYAELLRKVCSGEGRLSDVTAPLIRAFKERGVTPAAWVHAMVFSRAFRAAGTEHAA
ncbi:MAG TPA: hypothetical protein VF989_04450, partial [Polyangiaceae bacterium]